MSDQTTFDASTSLNDMAGTEAMSLGELSGGDKTAAQVVRLIQSTIGKVSEATRVAMAEAERLKADDVSNPVGIARLLDELPKNLEAVSYNMHATAEGAIAVLEARLTAVALAHDQLVTGISDTALRDELANHTANLLPADAAVRLVQLAANPRYSTFMAGPFGDSLAARFGTDPASLRRTALQTVAESGTPSQKAAAAALGKLHKATRVHSLSAAGTLNAVRSIRESKQTRREYQRSIGDAR
jgi:hypothetical protein